MAVSFTGPAKPSEPWNFTDVSSFWSSFTLRPCCTWKHIPSIVDEICSHCPWLKPKCILPGDSFFLCKTSLFLPIVVAWVPCGCWIILSLLEIFGLAGNIPTCHRNHLESFNPPYSCRSISSMLVGQIRNFNGIHGYAAVATWCRPTYPITFRWHTTIDQVHRYDVSLWHFHLHSELEYHHL